MDGPMSGMRLRLVVPLSLLVLLLSSWGTGRGEDNGAGPGKAISSAAVPRVIFSTDIATGSIDTFGGMSLSPVVYDADHAFTTDSAVVPAGYRRRPDRRHGPQPGGRRPPVGARRGPDLWQRVAAGRDAGGAAVDPRPQG